MKNSENIYQDAALVKKILLGEANEVERQEFQKRLIHCPDLQNVYEELQDSETLKTAFDEYQNYSSERAYLAFLEKIESKKTKSRKSLLLRVAWYSAAAIVILAIGLAFFLSETKLPQEENEILIQPGTQQAQLTLSDGNTIDIHEKKVVDVVVDGVKVKYKEGVLTYQQTATTEQEIKENIEKNIRSNELAIPRGGENTVVLADGTRVHLNAGSKLIYPTQFAGKRRMVILEGEAYFDVTKDEEHPFVVRTHLGEVTVLGTAFNVNAYRDASVCYTTLVHGKVSFSTPEDKTITLLPGEQAVISASELSKRSVNVDEYVGWVNGVYSFNNRTLGEIMQTFERWYDIQVYYETPDLRDIAYSGSVERYRAINTFLDALELTGDIYYKINGKRILIYKNE